MERRSDSGSAIYANLRSANCTDAVSIAAVPSSFGDKQSESLLNRTVKLDLPRLISASMPRLAP